MCILSCIKSYIKIINNIIMTISEIPIHSQVSSTLKESKLYKDMGKCGSSSNSDHHIL